MTCKRKPTQHRLTPSAVWTTHFWAVASLETGAKYTGRRRIGRRGSECRGVMPAAQGWTAQREGHAVIGAAEDSPAPQPARACSSSVQQQVGNFLVCSSKRLHALTLILLIAMMSMECRLKCPKFKIYKCKFIIRQLVKRCMLHNEFLCGTHFHKC